MPDILREFQQLSRQYEAIKTKALAQVKTWRWATGNMLKMLPFESLRQGIKSERWLDKAPRNKSNHTHHGLAQDGNVIVMQSWGPDRGDCAEHFCLREAETLKHTIFNDWDGTGRIQLLASTSVQLKNGQPDVARSFHSLQSLVRQERYIYEDGKLVGIEVSTTRFPGTKNASHDAYREELTYDEFARLAGIVAVFPAGSNAYPKGRSVPVYRRPKKSETIESLGAIVEERLVELIPRVVAAARIRQPVYCLVLGYGAEKPLPPALGLGLESERQAWLKQYGTKSGEVLWNPEEYTHAFLPSLELGGAELTKACDLLNLEIQRKKKYSAVQHLLNRVAARLMQRDWSKHLKPTSDFVVVASDIEGQNDLPANIKASAGQEVFKAFRSKGWI